MMHLVYCAFHVIGECIKVWMGLRMSMLFHSNDLMPQGGANIMPFLVEIQNQIALVN